MAYDTTKGIMLSGLKLFAEKVKSDYATKSELEDLQEDVVAAEDAFTWEELTEDEEE